MSDDEEDLRLNTLNRFRKRSPGLLLEQYSHCEVPAGCGGVVLRWVDPASTIPALVRVYCPGESKIFVDGNELGSSRVDLAAGAHVLALELSIPEPAGGPLLVTVLRMLGRDRDWGDRAVVWLRSDAGPRWRITSSPPPADWTRPEFDARGWSPSADATAALEPLRANDRWRIDQHTNQGARALALGPGRSWVRVSFEVPALDPTELED